MWWEWDANPGGPGDFGYSPKGKPAEDVLRAWFAEVDSSTSEPSADEKRSGLGTAPQ